MIRENVNSFEREPGRESQASPPSHQPLDNLNQSRHLQTMNKMEWPGIATAVGIVLILTLLLLGSRDDFHLKDWQTLIAAFVALGAATLAYRGAMAKVTQDGEQHKREFLRRQLGLYLKLDIAIRNFHFDLGRLFITLGRKNEGEAVEASLLKFTEPPEISEAWDNLDILLGR
jgi:hypothetical protein